MEQQKKILQARLDQMFQELSNKSNEFESRVSERQSLLDTVIAQIQEKRDQPAVKFLMVRLHSPWALCKAATAPIPELVSSELQSSVEMFAWKSQRVVDVLDKFKGKALLAPCCASPGSGKSSQVTLDPQTANLDLTLSDNNKSIRFVGGKQPPRDIPKRFTGSLSVLGSQGFTSGSHYWEVEVWEKGSWALGVA
ncbi:TRIM7 ligase, partial [Leptocoma aspasia]|nr:TRIM7 ligase [Leptocoma aspasia]